MMRDLGNVEHYTYLVRVRYTGKEKSRAQKQLRNDLVKAGKAAPLCSDKLRQTKEHALTKTERMKPGKLPRRRCKNKEQRTGRVTIRWPALNSQR